MRAISRCLAGVMAMVLVVWLSGTAAAASAAVAFKLSDETVVNPSATLNGSSVSIAGPLYRGFMGTLPNGDSLLGVELSNGHPGVLALTPSLSPDPIFAGNGFFDAGALASNEFVVSGLVSPDGSAIDQVRSNFANGTTTVYRYDENGNFIGTTPFAPPTPIQPGIVEGAPYFPSLGGSPTMLLTGTDFHSGNGLVVPLTFSAGGVPSLGPTGWTTLPSSGSASAPFFARDAALDPVNRRLVFIGVRASSSDSVFALDSADESLLNFGAPAPFTRGTGGVDTDASQLLVDPLTGNSVRILGRGDAGNGNEFGFATGFGSDFVPLPGFSDPTLPSGTASVFNRGFFAGPELVLFGEQPSAGGVAQVAGVFNGATGQPDAPLLGVPLSGSSNEFLEDAFALPILQPSGGVIGRWAMLGELPNVGGVKVSIAELDTTSPPTNVTPAPTAAPDLSVSYVNPMPRVQVDSISKWTVRVANDGTAPSLPTILQITLENTEATGSLDLTKTRQGPEGPFAFRSAYHVLRFPVPAIAAGAHQDFDYWVGPNDFVIVGSTGPAIHHATILGDGDASDDSPPSGDDVATFSSQYVTDATAAAANPCGAPRGKATDAKACSIAPGRAKSFQGTSSGHTQRVEVAIERASGRARLARGKRKPPRCDAVSGVSGKLQRVRSANGYCLALHWISARGTRHWTLKLRRSLPPGSYVLYVRPVSAAGAREGGFSPRAHDRVAFSVR